MLFNARCFLFTFFLLHTFLPNLRLFEVTTADRFQKIIEIHTTTIQLMRLTCRVP